MEHTDITRERAEVELVLDVDEATFGVVRSLYAGMSPEGVAKAYSVPVEEITELIRQPEYMQLSAWYHAQSISREHNVDEGWESLESQAVKNLNDVMTLNKDPELNLKIATIANRAQRRHKQPSSTPLDPNKSGRLVTISLNERYVKELGDGTTQVVERSATVDTLQEFSQPTLDDLSGCLGTSGKPNESQVPHALDGMYEEIVQDMAE